MPSRPWPLWLLTALLLIGFPALNFVYWPQVLASGVLPTDGDSIGIPMFGSVLFTIIVSPIALGLTWLCLRRYNSRSRLLAWRADRPYRSAVATLFFGGVTALLLISLIQDADTSLPWYEYLWSGYAILMIAWLLSVRAAAIEQLDAQET